MDTTQTPDTRSSSRESAQFTPECFGNEMPAGDDEVVAKHVCNTIATTNAIIRSSIPTSPSCHCLEDIKARTRLEEKKDRSTARGTKKKTTPQRMRAPHTHKTHINNIYIY